MVQLADPGKLRGESAPPLGGKAAAAAAVPVKLEAEDFLEEENGPLNKRSKFSAPFQQQWSQDASTVSSQPAQYNPLDEPSPLGLRLRKSPSLLDLIQMRLSQGNPAKSCLGSTDAENKDTKSTGVPSATDKLKASNFPATLLRIGTWECVSRYEGDLVAKCYYAKHKLVWEVLDGGLKSKIEIQWSDITALKAACPENGPGTLDIVLARQPLFFRETNPQPRKHTLWQATSDFTGGQASIHRRHFLQCPQGLLSKHFEKLIQCDPRLNALSRQPDTILESPYFEPRCSVFEEDTKCHGFDNVDGEYGSPFSGFYDAASPSAGPASSTMSEARDPVRTPDPVSRETASPSSVMDSRAIEENASSEAEGLKDLKNWDQFNLKVLGLHASMSMSDLVNHIGNHISEQISSCNPLFSNDALASKDMLEEITQYLLSDSQQSAASDENSVMSRVNSLCCLLQKDPATSKDMLGITQYLLNDSQQMAASDEKSLMKRVNSLCCLLQKDPSTSQSLLINKDAPEYADSTSDEPISGWCPSIFERKPILEFPTMDRECDDASASKQPPAMSRKESFGDLLLHLPRIASLPQFLFNSENHAR